MKQINAGTFIKSFLNIWDTLASECENEIIQLYADNKSWTKFMLGKEGLLHKVSEIFDENNEPVKMVNEYYTVDALFVGGENLFRDNYNYPSKIYALIEHENDENVEEELWKLIHLRSPLKIIIFYDWDNKQKKSNNKKKNWLKNKLALLFYMIEQVNDFNPESVITEYLLIVGHRDNSKSLPYWHFHTSHISPLIDYWNEIMDDESIEEAKKEDPNYTHTTKVEMEFHFKDSFDGPFLDYRNYMYKIRQIADEINKSFGNPKNQLKFVNYTVSSINRDT